MAFGNIERRLIFINKSMSVNFQGGCNFDKLGEIQAAFTALIFGYKTLWLSKEFCNLNLSHSCILARFYQKFAK